MIIPDTNLLIYAYNPHTPRHDTASRWWEGLVDGDERIGIPWIVAAGFIRLMTSRAVLTLPATLGEAVDAVDEWFSYPHVMPLNPGARHMTFLRQALLAAGVGGNLTTDAHIAALAMEYQAEVHSGDNDFGRFSGLRWHNPLTVTR